MTKLHKENLLNEKNAEKKWERLEYQRKYLQTMRITGYVLIVEVVVTVLLAMMFVPVLQVSSNSMEPTLTDSDVIVLLKTRDLQTGDLVCFYYQNKLLLKRVIGTSGDAVDIDEKGNVTVNGNILDEPYLTEKELGQTDITYPYQVPESYYFVMGDNRSLSNDSRSSVIGCIEKDQILGKVILRVWPLDSITLYQ